MYGELSRRTLVMGVLNVTPDSFSDGGRFQGAEAAVEAALSMVDEGADIIDVGGESSRPGAQAISADEEIGRVCPVLERLTRLTDVPVSIDTTKAEVAKAAVEAGALIVNDITALGNDPAVAEVAARYRLPLILMHMQGTPRTMQLAPHYSDLYGEITAFLAQRLAIAESLGVPRELLLVDPGFGFGKTLEHNLQLLKRLWVFRELGCPVLVGTSRKSSLGKIVPDDGPQDRLEATAATVAISIANGANIVRVHDVKAMVRVVRVTDAILHVD
ncbi:MAG: dihydropteroate synthase [Armatimonadetes bacterium]|nr:dihydropteroate synthase [Armatimonadota bacterium]